ncbi:acyltransferase family protein, partial [Vibrio sp. V36_P2S2PM302]
IWSYSIYLWHWPVIVFASIFNISLNIISQVSMVIISIVLGYFSYSYIEKKININVIFLLFTIVVSTSIFIEQNEVSPIKYSHIKDAVDSIARKPYECFDQEYIQNKTNFTCEISKGTKRILALGDSHMYSSLPVIEKIANKNNIGLEYVGFSGCPPLLDVYPIRSYSEKRNCQRLNKKTFEYSIDNIDIIYLAARWTYYTNGSYSGQGMQYLSLTNRMKNKDKFESINAFTTGLEKTLSEYNKYGKKVILLLQVPMQHRNADKIYFDSTSISGLELEKLSSLSVSYKDHINFQKFVNSKIISISKNFKNVVIVDPTNIYCNLKTCIVGNENESFYFDDDHLSVIGSFKMESYLERIFLENLDIN